MNKRAIVLGGAGLIGSHLCIRLLRDGYHVVCIDKRSRSESMILRNLENRNRFNYIKHDVTIPYEIGCDELYNLVSSIEYGDSQDYIEDQRTISLAAINSLNIIVGNNTKVLYGSSDDVYDFDKINHTYISPKQYVAEAKRFGESIHRSYNTLHKADIRIARIFSTYGVGYGLNDQHIISRMIVAALNNNNIQIFGNGKQVRTFCWVEDMVDGLISLMRAHNNSLSLTADLGSQHQITVRELAEMIISLTGSRSSIDHLPAKADEPPYKIPDLKIATDQLNWSAKISLQEGLMRTIQHIEKELSSVAISQKSWVEIYG